MLQLFRDCTNKLSKRLVIFSCSACACVEFVRFLESISDSDCVSSSDRALTELTALLHGIVYDPKECYELIIPQATRVHACGP